MFFWVGFSREHSKEVALPLLIHTCINLLLELALSLYQLPRFHLILHSPRSQFKIVLAARRSFRLLPVYVCTASFTQQSEGNDMQTQPANLETKCRSEPHPITSVLH
jgi:hypothetical protein